LEFDDGQAVFNYACKMGLEGIVSKRMVWFPTLCASALVSW